MSRPDVLALVLAGGSGSRMEVLTQDLAKPALPFGGSYQLIDFPLSNLHHSGIDDVWMAVQYQSTTLDDQVANGRPWDLDRTRGGLRLLPPRQGVGSEEDGFAAGNADVIFRHRDLIRTRDPRVLLVLSADHVYRMDYLDVVEAHVARDADCTVVTTRVSRRQASDHAVVSSAGDGQVTKITYKPERARGGTVATEVFAYRPTALLDQLERLHAELQADGRGTTDLGDFGDRLLPALASKGAVWQHPLDGYWQDVGTPARYVQAHRDLLAGRLGRLDDPAWPLLTRSAQRAPALIKRGATVDDSLVAPGCSIHGTVRRSVVGPGVRVERGAEVADSVLHADVVVEAGARVHGSVLAANTRIGRGARVGGTLGRTVTDERLVLIGRGGRARRGTHLAGGTRLEPGEVR